MFSILYNYLLKSEKSGKFKDHTKVAILSGKQGDLSLENERRDVLLYHLRLLQLLKQAHDAKEVKAYHFVLLRQVLENVASFLGTGRVSHVLEEIGVDHAANDNRVLNTLSHKNIYFYESENLGPNTSEMFDEIFEKLMAKYNFVVHA